MMNGKKKSLGSIRPKRFEPDEASQASPRNPKLAGPTRLMPARRRSSELAARFLLALVLLAASVWICSRPPLDPPTCDQGIVFDECAIQTLTALTAEPR
jgi:hypothetical protein